MRALFDLLGQAHAVTPLHRNGGLELQIGERRHAVAQRSLGPGEQLVTVDGKPHRVRIAAKGAQIFVHAGGRTWTLEALDERAGGGSGAAADHVNAPMPGTVVALPVAVGASVTANQPVLVIESMKLETTIVAPRDGVVAELPFAKGASFEKGATLVRFVPLEGKGEG